MYQAIIKDKNLFFEKSIRERKIRNGISIIEGKLINSKTDIYSSYKYEFDSGMYNENWVKKWMNNNKIFFRDLIICQPE